MAKIPAPGSTGDLKKTINNSIIHNGNFRNPVNQRASSSYTTVGYTIDRWRTWEDGEVILTDNGITHTVDLLQYIEENKISIEKKYTLAAGYSDGTISVLTGMFSDNQDNDYLAFGVDERNGQYYVKILARSKTVQWIALCEGEYTIDNLPKYKPNEYNTELLECMRYFEVAYGRAPASKGNFDNAYLWGATLNYRVPKRIIPTITTIENWFPGWYIGDQVGDLQYECNVYQAWPKIISGAGTVEIADFIGKQHHVTAYICADL